MTTITLQNIQAATLTELKAFALENNIQIDGDKRKKATFVSEITAYLVECGDMEVLEQEVDNAVTEVTYDANDFCPLTCEVKLDTPKPTYDINKVAENLTAKGFKPTVDGNTIELAGYSGWIVVNSDSIFFNMSATNEIKKAVWAARVDSNDTDSPTELPQISEVDDNLTTIPSEANTALEIDSSEVGNNTELAFNQTTSVVLPLTAVMYLLAAIIIPTAILTKWLATASISIIKKVTPLINIAITTVLSSLVSIVEYIWGDEYDSEINYSKEMLSIAHLL